jgi:hypothetical protein
MQGKIAHLGPPMMVLRLRALVLALGEASAPPWWRTEYLSGAGLRILERIYPRTAFAAALHASGAAARTIHDASTGRGSIYHLFRQPIPREREIRTLLLAIPGQRLTEELRPALGDRDALMEPLRALAVEVPEEVIGPWCTGNSRDLHRSEVYKRMAGAYLRGFETGKKIFPYVEVD